jgi:SPP1 family phage portal protein
MEDCMFGLGAIWNDIIRRGSRSGMTEIESLEEEIRRWMSSPARKEMLTGCAYYGDHQEIDRKQRTMIGIGGKRQVVNNLVNYRIMDNQYAKLVDQKANYLLAKPIELKTDGQDGAYEKALDEIFNAHYLKKLKKTGKNALNCGISWQLPYISENGELKIKYIPGYQVLPFWHDDEHEELDAAMRLYPVTVYEGRNPTVILKAEYYTKDGVRYYVYKNDRLIPDNEMNDSAYMTIEGKPMNWDRIPLIPFRANDMEHPLICRVKCLQDALNQMMSSFFDNLSEDIRSTILVLYNYDGEDLDTFRRNLMTYGCVKIRRDDYAKGGVEALHIEVNPDNYELVQKLLKKAIIENGRGFDAKDDRFSSGQANQMNIQSAYSDIDLDADDMESEFQESLESLLWFVNTYLMNVKHIAPTGTVQFIFNRDMLTNQAEEIQNCKNSVGILSDETIISHHPWTEDTADEIKKLKEQRMQEAESMNPYQNSLNREFTGDDEE